MNDAAAASDGAPERRIRLLVVDDENDFRESACRYFKRLGFDVEEAEDGEETLNICVNKVFDVIILDVHMPGMSGIEVLKTLRQREDPATVVMLTGGGTIEHAVESLKLGAYDFLTKPVKLDELARLVKRACQTHQLKRENKQLREVIRRQKKQATMIGDSPAMQEVSRLIDRTSQSDRPVLILGESGTGKELVARAIHEASLLADKPLVVVNCAALPDQLLESELFGHEKGAFTGAHATKLGLFEIADGGAVFIDEFGEMSGALQAKLLRVLEDGSMRRVGAVAERKVKVRVIAATNRDLEQDVEDKCFREDLFYRINVLGIQLPPLRERQGDIELLAREFAGPEWTIDDDVMERMNQYSWPGNVRQLANAIERAKVLADDDRIEMKNLPKAIQQADPHAVISPTAGSDLDLETLNRQHVQQTYERCDHNKTKTAQALGINRRSLYRLLEKFNLE